MYRVSPRYEHFLNMSANMINEPRMGYSVRIELSLVHYLQSGQDSLSSPMEKTHANKEIGQYFLNFMYT